MPRGAGRGGDPRCRGRLRGAPGGVPGGCRRDLLATRGREGSGWTARLPVGGPMTEDLLTLVIPTYNRPDFLERALRYYAAQQVRCPIVVADSSPSPAADANRRAADTRRPVLTIRYERYEPEIHVAQKIARALEDVPSPYAALGADDDFSIPASLERGAAFLASHPDYAMARGEAALVHLAPADDGRSIEAVRYMQRGIEGSTGTARLLDHLAHYSMTFYSVHRTAWLRQTWRTVAALELDYAFVELLPSCLSVIQGKCKQLGGLFLVRQGHAAQTSVNHLRDPLEWIGDSRWSGQQAAFRQALAEALIRQDGLGSAEAHEVVKRAYWACLAGLLAQKWQRRYGPQRVSARTVARWREIARRIPGLRSAWRSVRSRLPGGEFAIEALCRPSSRYYPDFMPVYRVVAGASAGEPPR